MSASPEISMRLATIWRKIGAATGVNTEATASNAGSYEGANARLLAVSKTVPAYSIRQALEAGQTHFGENYVQEALSKIIELADVRKQIVWHLIGPLQSNKTALVATHLDWVQTVDRLKIAQRLSEQRPANLLPLQILLQINADGAASKSGVDCTHGHDDLLALALQVASLPRLCLRGLMAIPNEDPHAESRKACFRKIKSIFDAVNLGLNPHGCKMDTLSLGMSGDFEEALAAGATMVRIGSAVFGQRQAP